MPSSSEPTAERDPRRMSPSPLTVAIVHGAIMLFASLVLYFVIPAFSEIFNALGGSLPASTQRAIHVSFFVRRHAFLVLAGMGLLLWGDARAYAALCRRFGAGAGRLWLWGWVVVLTLAVPAMMLATFTPGGS